MSTTGSGAQGDGDSSTFDEALADYLTRIERGEADAAGGFRTRHPEFAWRLGPQLEWLAAHMVPRPDDLPERIGPYRVQHQLGWNALGPVYLAEQTTPCRRPVVVKVIRVDKENTGRPEPFAKEVQALSSLNHAGIPRVFEAGDDSGHPYFAMEFVPGRPLTDFCNEEQLDIEERLRLLIDVCHAVEHVHQHGILHRDLKPAHMLVYGPRGRRVVKITGFGLAKTIDREDEARPRSSATQLVGTLLYMGPELFDDSGKGVVDARADVYSLGVVLYELLTGTLPTLPPVHGMDWPQFIRTIRECEPPAPSARVEADAPGRDTWPRSPALSQERLIELLAGDLDCIAMKALAKDPQRRYVSAAELARDIHYYLYPEGWGGPRPRVRVRFLRRRAGVASLLLVLAMACLVTMCSTWRT